MISLTRDAISFEISRQRIAISLVFALLFSAFSLASAPLESLGLYRWIEKGKRCGYIGNFPREVMVESRAELDSIRKAIDERTPSMLKGNAFQFRSIFDSTRINYEEESIALLSIALPSGSIKVTTGEPIFDGDTLRIPVELEYPEIGTDDMAYYVYALVVKKSVVKEVRLAVSVQTWAPPLKK
jgi:hypothetical protein